MQLTSLYIAKQSQHTQWNRCIQAVIPCPSYNNNLQKDIRCAEEPCSCQDRSALLQHAHTTLRRYIVMTQIVMLHYSHA